MKAINLERRVSIFDITTPYLFTEKKFDKYIEELKKVMEFPKRSFISDATASGEFVYGSVNNRACRNVRVEVDSRFITDDEVKEIMTYIFEIVK